MAFSAESRWQYKCSYRRAWVDVSAEEDRQLKEHYLAQKRLWPTSLAVFLVLLIYMFLLVITTIISCY